MILQGIVGGNFDVLAASGESTTWMLWKTRSRPIGVRVCPVAQFNFFSTAFDPRAWTIVVFWIESLRRQLQLRHLRTKEEIKQMIHLRQLILSLMILKFLLVRKVHSLRHALLNLMSRQIRLAYHQDGLQLHHLLVEEKKWEPEIHRVSGYLCDLTARASTYSNSRK